MSSETVDFLIDLLREDTCQETKNDAIRTVLRIHDVQVKDLLRQVCELQEKMKK